MARSKRHIPRSSRRKGRAVKYGNQPQSPAYQSAIKEYRKLAKRADQRLLRLERYSNKPEYENIKQYAYARAMRDIKTWSGPQAKRFNTKPPSGYSDLMGKINDIKWFLQAATSSIKPTKDNAVYDYVDGQKVLVGGGVDLTYQKRAASLNERYGTNLSWENVGWMFESALYRKLYKKFNDSKTAVRVIGHLQKHEEEILDAYNKGNTYNIKIKGEKPLEEDVNYALSHYGKSIKSLYKLL